ncbi:acyl carrier protein [Spirosoma koreense]
MNKLNKPNMKQRVIEILKQFGVPESAITEQTHFSRDLGLDSLDTVDLIMQLEKEFGIRIPDEDYQKLTTMNGVLTYLEAEQAVV